MPSYSDDHLILFTTTSIYSLQLSTQTLTHRYSSFNLSPYNTCVIKTKYLYFQSLEGLCLLNLKSVIEEPFDIPPIEILIAKTFNSTNQIYYDPRFERLLYFSDYETVEIIPLPHKNIIIPYGYNKMTGKVLMSGAKNSLQQEQRELDVCFVSKA